MTAAGMITEYNPLHAGHLYLMEEVRRRLGPDTAVVVCMSGDFVQRGDFAAVRRQARARAAVLSGADLVLELPVPWAVDSAEGFASGAVRTLAASGVVDVLAFGSECGDTAELDRIARILLDAAFPAELRRELRTGISFPAARQRAVERLGNADAAALGRPNDLLGVEYCKALRQYSLSVRPMAVPRTGAGHGDRIPAADGPPSSTAIRILLRQGAWDAALDRMAPAMRLCFREEAAAGRAPVFGDVLERAVLARLRTMELSDFAALDSGREGLYRRLYAASRNAVSVQEALERAKTRRYPLSRLRRMILRAFLGLEPPPEAPLYLRPLAMNGTGRKLLARMRTSASLPVLTKAGDVGKLGPDAHALFSLEARCADVYSLAYPDLAAAGGSLWKEGPWIAP